ncbi:hypothetical protein F7725_019239 [Dissostichus mawsoni]|uniref:Thrombomodulin n=1 Tax=Dissostichus mawsoni TaxID=36200 RepID=A0A7J5YJI4_DISMA|nr:hypothetical protein F7725_019239 [Dissostichus mawsoni]
MVATRLFCALLLCALQETVLSQHGHCTGNQCFAFFQSPLDFPGAEKSCRDFDGQLLSSDSAHFLKILKAAPTGRYWFDQKKTFRSPGKALQMCPSISVSNSSVLWEPCGGSLSGFLCQYPIKEICSEVPAGTDIQGGCEHNCSPTTHRCTCPLGKTLHHNNISCEEGMCEENPCALEGEQCQITPGGFKCVCKEGFEKEDGVCVNVTICEQCEHMDCKKFNGVYECVCKEGFSVSLLDPTRCEVICKERDCKATCIEIDTSQCFCPDGYISDMKDNKPFCTDINECDSGQCDQECENLFGGFRCLCSAGYNMDQEKNKRGWGIRLSSSVPDPRRFSPGSVPTYIKTGSVLGITLFMALCAVLLFFLIRNAIKRCGKFELSPSNTQILIFSTAAGDHRDV